MMKSPLRDLESAVPVLMHRLVMNDAATLLGRSRFQTGGRKIYADDCAFAHRMQVFVMIANVRMMGIDENIPATPPPYATVAPILHQGMRTDPANRSATLNNGATDANGR